MNASSDAPFYGRLTDLDVNKSFVPVQNARLQQLTPAQIDDWNEQGFIADVPVLNSSELAEFSAFFRDLERDASAKDAKFNTHARRSRGRELVCHPRTLGYLQDLIGADIVCFISEYINKKPGSPAGNHGHQDCVFNAMPVGGPIVWLALDDADEGNGCMQFVPGSHRAGVLECNDNFALRVLDPTWKWVPARARAGHAIIMSDMLIHSSPANPSATRERPGFTATYAAATTPLLEKHAAEPVLCCGRNIHASWNIRPASESNGA
jgi:hypothetical protein